MSEGVCGRCAGAGKVDAYNSTSKKIETKTCPVCKGSGRR